MTFVFPWLMGDEYRLPEIVFYSNIVVVMMIWILDFLILDLNKNIDFLNIDSGNVVFYIAFVIFNIAFWLPVAYVVDKLLDKFKPEKEKQDDALNR